MFSVHAPSGFSDEVNATRMGFQESNSAHQRTAERSHAFEQELHKTRQVVEELRAESTALKGQVMFSKEARRNIQDVSPLGASRWAPGEVDRCVRGLALIYLKLTHAHTHDRWLKNGSLGE